MELGLVPKFAYTAGDKRLTPKGNEIPGVRKESFWCCEFTATDDPIELVISSITMELTEKKAFLRYLIETGGRLEYFVGWFTTGNSGFDLTPDLLSQLASIGIGLSFDIYTENPPSPSG